MNLTPENKAAIDRKSMGELLSGIRFSPIGSPWFQGETVDYWMKRYAELRAADPEQHVRNSKDLGWER